VDADAFFASVEQALRPELKGRAVIVGGTERGVVTAASYEARRFGVRSAMPVAHARRLCPQAVFLGPNFAAYKEFSRRMFDIMRKYSPAVEPASIDEGYVDLTGTLRLHRAPAWEVAHRILHEIRSSLGINASGGLAGDKTAAKMATGAAKPNGLLYLEPHKAMTLLGALPVGSIPGIGKKAQDKLRRHGISTVAHLAATSRPFARAILGKWGDKAVEIAAGRNFRPVRIEPRESQKSYSKQRTLARDTIDYIYIRRVAREIAERLVARLRARDQGASTVTFSVRYADFTDKSRSVSLEAPSNANADILECVDDLIWKTITRPTAIRKVSVKLSNIARPTFQHDLFEPERYLKCRRDRALDEIRERFGFDTVRVSGGA